MLNPSAPPSPPPPSPSPPPPSPSPPPPSPPPSPSPPPVGYWSGFNPYNTAGVDCADWCKDSSAHWTVSDCLEASTEGHFPIWNVINGRGAWECSTASDGSFTPVKCNTFKFCAECDACYCADGNSTLSPNPGAYGPNLDVQSCYSTWEPPDPSGARIAAASSVVIDLDSTAPKPPPPTPPVVWTARRAYPPPPAPVATLSAWVDASGYLYSATLHAQNHTFASFYPSAEVRGYWEFNKTDVAYVFHPVCGMLCMVDDLVGHKTLYHGYNECRAVSAAMEFFLDDDRC